MWPHASGRDVRDGGERVVEGGALFPLNEALSAASNIRPLWLRGMGRGLDVDEQEEGGEVEGGGYAARQAARARERAAKCCRGRGGLSK